MADKFATQGRVPPQSEQSSKTVTYLDKALWLQLTEGGTLHDTLEAWLAIQCGMIEFVTQGVLVMNAGEADSASYRPLAVWPANQSIDSVLAKTAELTVAKQSGVVNRENQQGGNSASYLAYPLRISEELLGVIAIRVEDHASSDLKKAMRLMQWGSGWFEALVRRERAIQAIDEIEHHELALRLTHMMLDEPNFQTACVSTINELAAVLKCERVSLGFLHGDAVRVSTLSHTVQLDSRLNLLNAIASAMDEAVDQSCVVVAPAQGDDMGPLVNLANTALSTEYDSGQVVTVPFLSHKKPCGAVTFEKPKGVNFTDTELVLCETVIGHLGSLLEDRRRANRWFGAKISDYMAEFLGRAIGPGHLVFKSAAIAIIATLLVLIFAKTEYRVVAPAHLTGEIQRIIAAPFDGYISEAPYRAGDTVKKGDAIASLDNRDLVLEHMRWITERRQHLLEYDQALADQKPSELGVIRARIKQAESQLEFINTQLERSILKAPFDGVLVSGDLSQSIGGAVRKGDTLFEVVPVSNYRVVLEVDEADIRYINQGQEGYLLLTSAPDKNFPLSVKKLSPVAESREGRNFFTVEASLDKEQYLELRPGMEGVGKITTDKRRLIWVWTHRFSEWANLQVWSLWP